MQTLLRHAKRRKREEGAFEPLLKNVWVLRQIAEWCALLDHSYDAHIAFTHIRAYNKEFNTDGCNHELFMMRTSVARFHYKTSCITGVHFFEKARCHHPFLPSNITLCSSNRLLAATLYFFRARKALRLEYNEPDCTLKYCCYEFHSVCFALNHDELRELWELLKPYHGMYMSFSVDLPLSKKMTKELKRLAELLRKCAPRLKNMA